jgi:predicted ATPase
LTKAILETAPNGSPLTLVVPSTLQASLMARLDRRPAAKQVAQIGAVIGREFSHILLVAVAGFAEVELTKGLDELVAAGLAFRRGLAQGAVYSFKHALVQETAYNSLLRSRRAELHGKIAKALLDLVPDAEVVQPALLGHHCAEAGLIEHAVRYYRAAGEQSASHSAPAEAVGQLRRALSLAAMLPDNTQRNLRELEVQSVLAPVLIAVKGHAAPETGEAYGRARELCEELGETTRLSPILFGLSAFYVNRAELNEAWALGEKMLRSALQHQNNAPAELAAHRSLGNTFWHLGRLAPARIHLEQVLTLYDPTYEGTVYSSDSRTMALSFLAKSLLGLGYPDEARAVGRNAIAEARRLRHAFSLAQALATAGCRVDCFARDTDSLSVHVEELTALCTEQGFPFYLTTAMLYRGWGLISCGHPEEAVRQLQEGLAAYRGTGAEIIMPHFLGLLAEAHGKAGQPDRGLGLLAEALGRIERSEERWFEAELHRLRAELLLAMPSVANGPIIAETYLRRALATAHEQGARWWELRAACDLTRLLRGQGRTAAARDILQPVYAAFTEGFALSDLTVAKALLTELHGVGVS